MSEDTACRGDVPYSMTGKVWSRPHGKPSNATFRGLGGSQGYPDGFVELANVFNQFGEVGRTTGELSIHHDAHLERALKAVDHDVSLACEGLSQLIDSLLDFGSEDIEELWSACSYVDADLATVPIESTPTHVENGLLAESTVAHLDELSIPFLWIRLIVSGRLVHVKGRKRTIKVVERSSSFRTE